MNANEVIETFKRTSALLEGHFILSSGLHSSIYLQCAIALESTTVAMEFGAAIAERLKDQQIETVASPAIGGIVIGYEVARQLRARFIWTEREEGRMTLRRGFTVHDGERVKPRLTFAVRHILNNQQGFIEESLLGLGLADAMFIGALATVAFVPDKPLDLPPIDHVRILW